MSTLEAIYVGAFGISGLVCFAAITRARQFEAPDVRRGLVWLLASAGGWALLKAVYFELPDPFGRATYIAGLAIGFSTVWGWLYFCSAYTGNGYHKNETLRRVSVAVILTVVSLKVTNPIHGAYFDATAATTPFAHLAIEHNVLHWTATGLSYVLAALGMFMLFELYMDSGYDTRQLSGLTALIGVPVVLDMIAQFTPFLIAVIYAPIGVAAFAVGVLFVFEGRFLAVQQDTVGDGTSIYLGGRGRIRDYSDPAAEMFPALAGSTGDRLSDVLPEVADAVDGENRVVEVSRGDEKRYYFVSASSVSLADTSAELVQLSDVTETERQRRELIRREQELDEQNELYRAVIDASFAFVFRIDLEGRFTFVSSAVEEFLGYSPEELEGEQMSVTHPDEATTERAWDQVAPVLAGESNTVREFPLETKDGSTVYTDVRGVPIYEGSVPVEDRTPDDIVAIQLMVRDATERRQRKGLISVINRVLRHNLRNQMTMIINYARTLENRLAGEDAAKATHILDVSERLLDLSDSAQEIEENRELSPELEPIDLRPMVDRTVSQVRTRYPEATVTVDAPETIVAESHERVETAIWEIVDNAAKHGGDPPVVEIEVTVSEREVAIAVSDNGPGLPDVEREVLESSIETPLVHGEGLGLWLVYWIVSSLDGDLNVEPSPAGTTITVFLDRATEDVEE